METIYFVLGMLSIIGAAILATIVWGTLKIVNLLKAIKQHEEWMASNERNVYDNMHRLREDLDRRIDDMDRHVHSRIDNLQRELDGRFSDCDRDRDGIAEELHRRINTEIENTRFDINSQITDAVTQSTSYTDKRIDKLIDTYFDVVSVKKQVIKG